MVVVLSPCELGYAQVFGVCERSVNLSVVGLDGLLLHDFGEIFKLTHNRKPFLLADDITDHLCMSLHNEQMPCFVENVVSSNYG